MLVLRYPLLTKQFERPILYKSTRFTNQQETECENDRDSFLQENSNLPFCFLHTHKTGTFLKPRNLQTLCSGSKKIPKQQKCKRKCKFLGTRMILRPIFPNNKFPHANEKERPSPKLSRNFTQRQICKFLSRGT